jgi:hypothetical protein
MSLQTIDNYSELKEGDYHKRFQSSSLKAGDEISEFSNTQKSIKNDS